MGKLRPELEEAYTLAKDGIHIGNDAKSEPCHGENFCKKRAKFENQ